MKGGLLCAKRMRRAFTLIELIVVIAIIALLASLLIPALSRAKAASRGAACRNNLRQAYLTLAMYLSDLGAYPAAVGVGSIRSQSADQMYPLPWYIALAEHSDIAWNVYACPQEVKYESAALKFSEGKLGSISVSVTLSRTNGLGALIYGYNASGSEHFGTGSIFGLGESLSTPLLIREQTIQAPAEMIAFGDSQSLVISPTMTFGNPPARHNGKANLSFCDGHIEANRPAQWIANSETARARWNNDFQPHF